MHRINYWVVVVRVHAPPSIVPRPVYSEELGAAYVADVAPALVRKVELGEYCVLADWSIAEVVDWCATAADAAALAALVRGKHPELDVRELMTAE
jgi:hypothetical protein